MAEDRVHRRLAAIVVADVVGYSRLMELDEAGTLAALKGRRTTILQPTVGAHGGRIVKVMGDGVLIEFASAVNAVNAALELQGKMAEANEPLPEHRRFVLRIGINLGDVIGEGSDVYGDGVNIAARLEAMAEPGGVCVSAKVAEEVARQGRLCLGRHGRDGTQEHRQTGSDLPREYGHWADGNAAGRNTCGQTLHRRTALHQYERRSRASNTFRTASPRTSSPSCRGSGTSPSRRVMLRFILPVKASTPYRRRANWARTISSKAVCGRPANGFGLPLN